MDELGGNYMLNEISRSQQDKTALLHIYDISKRLKQMKKQNSGFQGPGGGRNGEVLISGHTFSEMQDE